MHFDALLAQTENPILSVSKRLQNSQGLTVRDLLIFFAIGAAIGTLVLVLTFIGRALGWWSRHSSGLLFRELCAAHQLNAANRRLLRKLAHSHKIADQASIFLMPEKFDEKALPPQLLRRSAEIAAIKETLFGSAA